MLILRLCQLQQDGQTALEDACHKSALLQHEQRKVALPPSAATALQRQVQARKPLASACAWYQLVLVAFTRLLDHAS